MYGRNRRIIKREVTYCYDIGTLHIRHGEDGVSSLYAYPTEDNVITHTRLVGAYSLRLRRWVGWGCIAGHQSNKGPLTGAKQISSRCLL